MNFAFLSRSLLAAGLLLGGARAAAGQDLSPIARYPKAQDLVVRYFKPRSPGHFVEPLVQTAQGLLGPTIEVQRADGSGTEIVSRFLHMSNTIIVRDTPAGVERALEVLAELDHVAGSAAEGGDATAESLESAEFSPRHVSAAALAKAIEPYRRKVSVPTEPGQPPALVDNFQFLRERSLIVVRETVENIRRIREILERVDVPRPQVLVTAYVILGVLGEEREAPGSPVPAELVQNLKNLLPFGGFGLLSVGVLRTAVSFDEPIRLRGDAGPQRSFTLMMMPEAYDAKTGALILSSCTFELETRVSGEEETVRQSGFTTRATIGSGEYTVLGAVGSEPVFVVLRVTPVGG